MRFLPPTQEERQRLARLLFFLALGWFVLGFIITFVPGSELIWFTIGACQFLFIILICHGSCRFVAGAFLFLSLLLALFGYCRGLDYQAWLAEHSPPNPVAVPPP